MGYFTGASFADNVLTLVKGDGNVTIDLSGLIPDESGETDLSGLVVDAQVKYTNLVIWHDPRHVRGEESDRLNDVIDEIRDGNTIYTTRQDGSFVSESEFLPPLTETLTIDGETHDVLVVRKKGNAFENYQKLYVELNDQIFLAPKVFGINLSVIENGFDWIWADSQAKESDTKLELRINVQYDTNLDETRIRIHREPIPSSQEDAYPIYLFVLYFENAEVSGVKGEKGDKGDPGDKGDKGDPGVAGVVDGTITRAKLSDTMKDAVYAAEETIISIFIVSDTPLDLNREPVAGSGTFRYIKRLYVHQILVVPTMRAGTPGVQRFYDDLWDALNNAAENEYIYETKVEFNLNTDLNEQSDVTGQYGFSQLIPITKPVLQKELDPSNPDDESKTHFTTREQVATILEDIHDSYHREDVYAELDDEGIIPMSNGRSLKPPYFTQFTVVEESFQGTHPPRIVRLVVGPTRTYFEFLLEDETEIHGDVLRVWGGNKTNRIFVTDENGFILWQADLRFPHENNVLFDSFHGVLKQFTTFYVTNIEGTFPSDGAKVFFCVKNEGERLLGNVHTWNS